MAFAKVDRTLESSEVPADEIDSIAMLSTNMIVNDNMDTENCEEAQNEVKETNEERE